jgi:hypothetical protein
MLRKAEKRQTRHVAGVTLDKHFMGWTDGVYVFSNRPANERYNVRINKGPWCVARTWETPIACYKTLTHAVRASRRMRKR